MTKFLVVLMVFISCAICRGADSSEIPVQTNTQLLDKLLDSIRTTIAPIGTTTVDLKKHLCQCSNISPEQYIASFLYLLDHHSEELNAEELSDIHFYIAEELYKTIDYQLVWQYINLYPTINHELLESHKLFLAGLIFANNKENATKAIEKYFDVKSIYEKYQHSNQIRLHLAIAHLKGENGFLKEAMEYYEIAVKKTVAFPNHERIPLLKANYLYFLSENQLLTTENITPEAVKSYLADILSINDDPIKLLGLGVKLGVSHYIKLSKKEIIAIINQGEAIINAIPASNSSHILLNRQAELYWMASKALSSTTIKEYDLALYYVNKAIKMYQEKVTGLQQQTQLYKLKISLFQETGKTDQIYDIYLLLDSLNNSYHTFSKNNAIAGMNAKLQVQEEQLKTQTLENKNKVLNLLIFVVVFVLLIVLFLVNYFYKNATEKQQLNKELNTLNNELETVNSDNLELIKKLNESNENLENFAYIAAHDIKAPIRTISSFGQLLYKKYENILEEEHKIWFDFILSDSSRLSSMVDSLLGFSKLTQNLPTPTTIDLNVLLEEIILKLASSRKNKTIHFKLPSVPIVLNTHASLISQLFLNLLSNSMKFSKESAPNTISITWENKRNEYLEFQVTDTGIGIPEAVKPTIFKLFSKYSKHRDNKGNGIGLSTCSRVVSFLGGQIDVESVEGKGTTMIFTLKIDGVSDNVYHVHGG